MSQKKISSIIEDLQLIKNQEEQLLSAEVLHKINQAILDLKEIEKASKVDKALDRFKKATDIINPILKTILDFLSG